MTGTSLTARELALLDGIEQGLRRDDPRLGRLLERPPGPLTRLAHRPRPLAALVALLCVLTATAALCAGAAAGPVRLPAALAAGGAALLGGWALRRLAAVRQD
ncbi:DUF3040 domain-containing protein [Kitasatospora sp. NPDC088134]|uniref:DUF3040 domain-containing protein n=1 Tax=Kitasatospora sp. NPDC088134 TaxID=3364071 RepID=UPI0037F92E53